MTRLARYSLALLLLVTSLAYADSKTSPLLAEGQPVDWWFVFKFNTETLPGCGTSAQTAIRSSTANSDRRWLSIAPNRELAAAALGPQLSISAERPRFSAAGIG